MKRPEMVMIEWDDTSFSMGWHNAKCLRGHSPSKCQTVGHLLKLPTQRKPYYIVAMTASEDDSVADTTQIPKNCVKKVRKLTLRKRRKS